ncbi:MAG: transketolase C-terminal domain-containing protein [bacterium]
MKTIIEGSRAIAETIKQCQPQVISAYPITPQTHIVEDLAKFKADGKANYKYIRAESEFAAASIVAGASATGVRTYTATSSQGLLLMAEVLFNIAGMRLPVVMTCANRAVSAPINIWGDQQDSVTVRDSGWIMLYAENNQEACDLHIQAFKIAETVRLPVMINIDGFLITHTYEPVDLPKKNDVIKFVGKYNPKKGTYLDTKKPISMGCFAPPSCYMGIREQLQNDLIFSKNVISQTAKEYEEKFKNYDIDKSCPNGIFEEYKTRNAETILITMGSVAGTIKDAIDELSKNSKTGLIKLRCFRPFPDEELIKSLKKAKYIGVIEKCVSLGSEGILAGEIKRAAYGKLKAKIQSFIAGLGGRDVTKKMVKKILQETAGKDAGMKFVE